MAGKIKITRKVIGEVQASEPETPEQDSEEMLKQPRSKRVCSFCQSKSVPSYTDVATIRRYLTDRAKIVPKLKSGLCSKHQRAVTRQIKYARHLSLLPFTPGV